MKRFVTCLIAAAILFSASQSFAAGPIKCAGCKTEYYVMKNVADKFQESTGGKMAPGKTGNKKAIALLADGKIDFAFCCQPHKKLANKFGVDSTTSENWTTTSIAKDPIVVIVNDEAGKDGLTIDEITKIFTGEVTNWKELGGADMAIKTAFLDSTVESGIVPLFKETTVGKDTPLLDSAKPLGSPSQLCHFANREPGAITFVGFGSYQEFAGDEEKSCEAVKVNDVQPSVATVVDGTYPLVATYYLIYDKNETSKIQPVLDFLASDEGMEAVSMEAVAIEQEEVH